MTGVSTGEALLYALMLVLPLSALAGRRIGWRRGGSMALAWLSIFAAVIVIAGQRTRIRALTQSARERIGGAPVRHGATLRVAISEDGHFWVTARVNGHSQRFLIDSGATTSAMGSAAAAAAGIDPAASFTGRIAIPLETANGTVLANRATIAALDVGGIVRSDLGVVVAPAFGAVNVLGMNFLSSLSRWSVEDDMLVLVG